jgi:hypothetical protein
MIRKPVAAAAIRLLVLDVDGVLTDGRLYFGPRGETLKAFDVRDGYGIRQLMAAGIAVAVISGRRSAAVSARCRELGIARVMQGRATSLRHLSACVNAPRLPRATAPAWAMTFRMYRSSASWDLRSPLPMRIRSRGARHTM